jgi:MSHA pilin protein MshC
VLGILAVYAAPRMFNSGDFYARGFHDETLALLRYAQKTAIAQRRMVCATFDTTANTLVLTMENPTLASPAAVVCNVDLSGPRGEVPAKVTARSGVTYSAATSLIFDGLGQPVSSARVALASNTTVKVANASNTITVEATTGYVHE